MTIFSNPFLDSKNFQMESMAYEENSCNHKNRIDNICTYCGRCFDEIELQSPSTSLSGTFNTQNMKYSFIDPLKVYDNAIMKILISLNLKSHLSSVKTLLLATKFRHKINNEDKAIVGIYHILKSEGFPIVMDDLTKYSRLSKYRLLKIHRDTFKFVGKSQEYLEGVFDRTKALFEKFKKCIFGNFNRFCKYSEEHKSTDPKSLCIAYFLEVNNIPTVELKKIGNFNIHQIRNIRAKIKKK
jgi:hypothetical protein